MVSCVDSKGIKRDFKKGLKVKEIAEKYIITEDMVKHVIDGNSTTSGKHEC